MLAEHYPDDDNTAFVASVNGQTYVMQTHENLYERQDYAVSLPKCVRGLTVERGADGIRLTWEADPEDEEYRVRRVEGTELPAPRGYSTCIWHEAATADVDPQLQSVEEGYHVPGRFRESIPLFADAVPVIGRTREAHFVDVPPDPAAVYTYTVTAVTPAREVTMGTVNYLDYLVFSEAESQPGEQATVWPEGRVAIRAVEPPARRAAGIASRIPDFRRRRWRP